MLTIGQRLKKEREVRYITIEKASDETRIRINFLKALEADDYSVMPSAAQGRGFLRNYAEYLNINIDEMIAEMQRNAPPPQEISGPLPQVNLVETEMPALTEEKETTSFWKQRLNLAQTWFEKKQTDSTLEERPVEIQAEPILEEAIIEKKKTSGRKKKKVTEESETIEPVIVEVVSVEEEKIEAQEMPIEVEQATAENEAQPSLLKKILSWFSFSIKKEESVSSSSESEIEEEIVEEKQTAKPSLPADVIFINIGKQLRERRELISLTIEEVERHTKLRAIFVKALEEGSFDKLPSTVQTRGMLNNYSTFLDMDTDAILLQFADALQARRHEKYSETPREKIQTEVKASIPLLRSFIAGDLVFGITMIAVLIALGVWGVGRVISSREEANAEPTSASIVDILADEVTFTPTSSDFLPVDDPALATNQAGLEGTLEAPTPSLNANVVVGIFSVERAFVRIAVDGEIVFEGRIAPFETLQYEAEEKVEILTGNAAALRITYNGRDLGLMGNVGEVTNRVYTISGVVAPTATPLPTATNTPLVTNTPTMTITPTATTTVEPSP